MVDTKRDVIVRALLSVEGITPHLAEVGAERVEKALATANVWVPEPPEEEPLTCPYCGKTDASAKEVCLCELGPEPG